MYACDQKIGSFSDNQYSLFVYLFLLYNSYIITRIKRAKIELIVIRIHVKYINIFEKNKK